MSKTINAADLMSTPIDDNGESGINISGFRVDRVFKNEGETRQDVYMDLGNDVSIKAASWDNDMVSIKGQTVNLFGVKVKPWKGKNQISIFKTSKISMDGAGAAQATAPSAPPARGNSPAPASTPPKGNWTVNEALELVAYTADWCDKNNVSYHFSLERFVNCLIMQNAKAPIKTKGDFPTDVPF